MTQADQNPKQLLLQAALLHVPFDGWSKSTFDAAITESGVAPALANALFPRGALDLALAFHKAGDALMLARLNDADLSGLRFRDKITTAVRFRLEAVEDRELVRRGATLFSLPQHVPDGAKAIWDTCDAIWTALGDTSDDVNWYTKRMTLSAVYSSVVLYWLGDDSDGHEKTWAFLDRRIEGVMRFEKAKAGLRKNPLFKPFLAGPERLFAAVRAPSACRNDLPGALNTQPQE